MTKPKIPFNESERLLALEGLNILDTLPEECYDDITKIASFICNTPISLVSLIDKSRQVFKSRQGIDVPESSRDIAFCAHAINAPDELMIVNDARVDERFSDNPLVTGDLKVIFYAGMPLVTSDGLALGTLCVIDNKPRELSEGQKNCLKSLSKQVIQLFELRKKNALLESTQKELKLAAAEMESFAHMASHDLKEPLRMVQSFMNLLEKKYNNKLDETARKYIYFAVDGSRRMEILISDLLEYAHAGKIHNDYRQTDISEVVGEIIQLHSLIIKEKKVIIKTSEVATIEVNYTAIRQVLQNLIGNAIKYHEDGVEPVITVGVTDKKKYWQFSVTDNGIGISVENLENIFTAFKRLHNNEKYAGTGIGLAICKKIVQKQGGRIWVESKMGEGSTFYFTVKKNKDKRVLQHHSLQTNEIINVIN